MIIPDGVSVPQSTSIDTRDRTKTAVRMRSNAYFQGFLAAGEIILPMVYQ
jgi:hypothetical protein